MKTLGDPIKIKLYLSLSACNYFLKIKFICTNSYYCIPNVPRWKMEKRRIETNESNLDYFRCKFRYIITEHCGRALDHDGVWEKSRCHREEPLMIDASVGWEGLLSSIRHPQRRNSRRLVSHGHSHRRCLPTYGGKHGELAICQAKRAWHPTSLHRGEAASVHGATPCRTHRARTGTHTSYTCSRSRKRQTSNRHVGRSWD